MMINKFYKKSRSALYNFVRSIGYTVSKDHLLNLCLNNATMKTVCDDEIQDVNSYMKLLYECQAEKKINTTVVKHPTAPSEESTAKLFKTMRQTLEGNLPVIPLDDATVIAKESDIYLDNLDLFTVGDWKSDVSFHYKISSSLGVKGRILAGAVRASRPKQCLEIGTAYGMSSLYISSTLKRLGEGGKVDTFEISEPQFSLASKTLNKHFPKTVTCHRGYIEDIIPDHFDEDVEFDFVFHDGGHGYKHYIDDFATMQPHLKDGAIVIFDDIRWEESLFNSSPARTYKGWSEIVKKTCVEWAIEIDKSIGILCMKA